MKRTKTILCYGDSNTHGYNPQGGGRFPREVRWTGCLQKLLGDLYEVVEEGCNGRTTMYGEADDWINGMLYLRPCLYSHRTVDYMILMLGTNDLKNKYLASAEKIGEGVEALVKESISFLKEHQSFSPKIILIAPPVLGEDMPNSCFADEFDAESVAKSYRLAEIYEQIAKKYQCAFLNAAMFAPVSSADSLHLSAESHAAFASSVYECIIDLEKII